MPLPTPALEVSCRVYRGSHFRGDLGAIIAHPYAPLGDSFDDPVVGIVVAALLEAGLVVGTFNFR